MAASQAGQRELHYYVGWEQGESIMKVVKSLGPKGATVGRLSEALKYYNDKEMHYSPFKRRKSLFQFLENYCF